MRLTVRQHPKNRDVFRLIDELEDRYRAIIYAIPGAAAKTLQMLVQHDAPAKLVPGYPDFLKVYSYDIQGADAAAGLVAPGYAHSVRLTGKEATTTVIFVKAKRYQGWEPDPGALLLERHNPWTMATLPYEPDRLEASLIARRERHLDVADIEAKRYRERRAGVDNQLVALGKRVERVDPKRLSRRVTFDIAHAVLRAEFGLGDVKKAHWRPAVRKLRSIGIRGVLKDMSRWFGEPGESRWKRGETIDEGQGKDVKRVQGFQDRVAVR